MSEDDLRHLFEGTLRVETSCGLTEQHDVNQLSDLAPEETPMGFHSWAEKRKREYRSGRHHARQALRQAGAPAAPILRDDDGVPVFPSGFSGSITHTGRASTFAAAAVVPGSLGIGIDAETIRDLPGDMVAHILSDGERATLGANFDHVPSLLSKEGPRALLAFSAKEAFYKCVFPQLRCRLSFHDVEFSIERQPLGSAPGEFSIRMLRGDLPGAPIQLSGRYLLDDSRVICGMTWSSPGGGGATD